MSQAIQLTCQANRNAALVIDQPQLVYVLTEIHPGAEMSADRLPLNFTLVLDRSGSMSGEKLNTMKEAVKNIIDQLDPGDIISIVTFETRTQALLPAQVAANKGALKHAVDQIRSGGGTNMALGLKEGLSQVSLRLQPEAQISRIILLTDGEATDNENDSRRLAEQAAAKGIPIICLGFGKDWKHDFLIDLADRSIGAPGTQSGYADYIPDPGQVQRIFQEVYRSMQVVARDATLTMRLALGVEARRVWQAAPLIREIGASAIQGRAVVIPMSGGRAGDLEAGGSAYLAEITLPPRPVGAVRVAQCDLTYTLPGGAPQRQSADLVVSYTPDLDATRQVNGQVMAVVEKVQAFKLQTQALSEAELGNLPGATQKLRQAVTILLSQGETELAGQMEQEAERLEQGGEISDEGKKTIKLTSRKTVRLSGGKD